LPPLPVVGGKDKILIDIVKENFKNCLAFKETIRKFLNMIAVHIKSSRHPPICLFETVFRASVPVLYRFRAGRKIKIQLTKDDFLIGIVLGLFQQ
jgi:hypothetical protein